MTKLLSKPIETVSPLEAETDREILPIDAKERSFSELPPEVAWTVSVVQAELACRLPEIPPSESPAPEIQ